MPRETDGRGKITGEVLYNALLEGTDGMRSEYKVMTVQDLAKELDVSDQAVRNHIDELERIDDVASRKIDRSTVYWVPRANMDVEELRGFGRDLGLTPHEALIHDKQAKWRFAKKQALRGQISDSPAETRAILYEHLYKYITTAELRGLIQSERTEDGVKYHPATEGEMVARLDEDDVAEYATEHLMFTSEWFGEVRGVAGLLEFNRAREARLKEIAGGEDYNQLDEYRSDTEDVFDEEKITDQDIDEIYPSLTDLVGAGEKIDQIAADIYNIEA